MVNNKICGILVTSNIYEYVKAGKSKNQLRKEYKHLIK